MNFIYLFIYFLVGQYLNILEEERQIYIYIYTHIRANLNFFILFFFNWGGGGGIAPLCPSVGLSLAREDKTWRSQLVVGVWRA